MGFRGDSRAQSIQIGAVLIFGILIILLSLYQAFVVPDQNEEIEFNHNEEVQEDMADVRNAVISRVGSDSSSESVAVTLGTTYPSRTIFVNPGPPSGSLRTEGTTRQDVNITIRNASASGDIGDFWNGDERNFSTGGVIYRPNYNLYENAPTTIYENTVLFNRFKDSNITLSDQSLVQGTTINVAALNGTVSASRSGTTNLDVRSVSASENRITVESDGTGPIEIDVPTRLSREIWNQTLLGDEAKAKAVGVSDHPVDGLRVVTIQLEDDTYNLRMGRVGLGTNVERSLEPAYLMAVDGDNSTVTQGSKQKIVLELRDAYNNPLSGELVQAANPNLDKNTAETDANGQVEFTYSATGGTGDKAINFTADLQYAPPDSSFDPDAPRNVTASLTVSGSGGGGGGGSSVFNASWVRPPYSQTIASSSAGALTLDDFRGSPFRMRLTDGSTGVSGISVDYGVNDDTIAAVDPGTGETDSNGYNQTRVLRESDGYTGIFVSAGGGSDKVSVTLDRFLNESYEDVVNTDALLANAWTYEDNGFGGDGGVIDDPSQAVFGDKIAYIDGGASTSPGTRALEMNYTIDTSDYDAMTLSYVAREPGDAEADDPDANNNGPSENLGVEYRDSNGNWIEVDNVSAGGDNTNAIRHFRRVRIESVANATHPNFQLRFTQGETIDTSQWQIDGIEFVGLSTSQLSDVNQGPYADFRYTPRNPSTADIIEFYGNRSDDPDADDLPVGQGMTYEWDWDNDGTYEATGEQATHSYSSSGTKTVTLKVTDADGKTNTTNQTVSVSSGGPSGLLQYVSGSMTASAGQAGTGAETNVTYQVENVGAVDVTVNTITVWANASGATQYETNSNNCNQGQNPFRAQIYFETNPASNFGCANQNQPYNLGEIVDLGQGNNQQAQINAGTQADAYISEFVDGTTNPDPTPITMTGETVEIRIAYTDANGNSYTLRISDTAS